MRFVTAVLGLLLVALIMGANLLALSALSAGGDFSGQPLLVEPLD
jgi:hypothetical protein